MTQKSGTKGCPIHFDHESLEHARNWADEFRQIREECPMAWTDKHGGYWVATRYKDVVAMAQDDQTFSSFKTFDPATNVVTGGITIPKTPIPRGLPVESDKPEWNEFRTYINRKFAPKAVETRRANARKYATWLLNRVIETGEMDLVNDFTGPVPAMVTMEFMGLPLEEWREFADPLHEMVYTPKESPEYPRVIQQVEWVFQRCYEEFARAKNEPPRDTLLSYFAHEKMGDRYITEDEMLSYCTNIITGGVDTTTALTTHGLVYLATRPQEKQAIIEDPKKLKIAREEFVRFYTPIHGLARTATRDVAVGESQVEAGDPIYLAWAAANRDPEVFEQPEEIDLTRFPNRHVAFGAGMHRCIGSNIARIMFEEMVAEMFDRIPEYQVHPERAMAYTSVGTINGWVDMPCTFKPGPKVAVDLDL